MRNTASIRFVHVQSVLPQEDIIALKIKTGSTSVKDAIAKAVYHYLNCDKELDKYKRSKIDKE